MIATVVPLLRLAGRAALSGPEEVWDPDSDFRVHYTREGADAPAPADLDANGRPDLVDAIGPALAAARDAYAAEGWRALSGDEGADGTDAIDVYVWDIEDYGFASPASTEDGLSCWLSFDRGLVPGPVADSVVAHELHHCVEFRYTGTLAPWLYESAATYEQYSHVTAPTLDLGAGLLYLERLDAPEKKLATTDGRLEYAAFVWMKHWAEREGSSPDALLALWEELGGGGGWQVALDRAAQAVHGRTLDELFLEHAVWNGFACANDDGAHYDPAVIPCVVDFAVPITAWDGAPITLAHDEAPFTAATLELPPTADPVGVRCASERPIGVAVVPLDGDGVGQAMSTGRAGDLVVAEGAGGPVRVVVAGLGDLPLAATCATEAVPLVDEPGCGCDGGADLRVRPGAGLLALALALLARTRRAIGAVSR